MPVVPGESCVTNILLWHYKIEEAGISGDWEAELAQDACPGLNPNMGPPHRAGWCLLGLCLHKEFSLTWH